MAFFASDGICPADLYQFSDQLGGMDSYNIKQPSSATLERESLLNSRQRCNSAYISTQRGPSVNLRTASHKPKKQLTKKMAYKKPSSSEALKQPRENHNLAEKRHRSRLKNHFESLLAILPMPPSKDGNNHDSCDHCFSRAEVLALARERIVSLEEGFEAMAKERGQLLRDIAIMFQRPPTAYLSQYDDVMGDSVLIVTNVSTTNPQNPTLHSHHNGQNRPITPQTCGSWLVKHILCLIVRSSCGYLMVSPTSLSPECA
ncbi:hypothetical protein DER44DRAFT_735457 [Fusarium oxysporum]|nr:hypothetical protein DER44DRAFT_735457 [Fusarium oxysporum]